MKPLNDAEARQLAGSLAAGKFWAPKTVKLKLLEACNWRCPMCHWNGTGRDGLSAGQWLEIIGQLAAAGVEEIGFSGGEPILYPGLEQILEGIAALDPGRRITLKILTNASRLTAQRVERLLELGLRRFIVSLHGASPATHDAIVGVPGAWQQTLAGIRCLRAKGAHIWINTVVQPANLAELAGVLELAAGLGCQGVNLNPLHPGPDCPPEQRVSLAQVRLAHAEIFPQVRRVAAALGIGLSPADAEIYGTGEQALALCASGALSRGYYDAHPCLWPFLHLTITANGSVLPCCNIAAADGYGSALAAPLADLLSGPRVDEFLARMRAGPGGMAVCRACAMKLDTNRQLAARLEELNGHAS